MTMKTGRVMICCVALLLALTSVSAVQQELNSINDLKEINFGQSVPKHSLRLLYWFANAVDIDGNDIDENDIDENDIDENDIMRLTFDPESRAYGSHHYGNFEGLLDNLPSGNVRYQYYTIGSLNQETSMQLPSYAFEGSNRDRIIIRIRQPNTGSRVPQMIDQVYITQHLDNQPVYDPDHTYRITTNLLRQIRLFSVGQNHQQLLQVRNRFGSNANVNDIMKTWGRLAGLGLLLYIVIQEKDSSNQRNRQEKRQNHLDDVSESNVHIHVGNQENVPLMDDDEDVEANRTTLNRQSDIASRDHNSRISWGCCCCCIAIGCITIVSAICIILYLRR